MNCIFQLPPGTLRTANPTPKYLKSESAAPFWTGTAENANLRQCPSSGTSAKLLTFHPEEISPIPQVQIQVDKEEK
jgi:hypothetical protein